MQNFQFPVEFFSNPKRHIGVICDQCSKFAPNIKILNTNDRDEKNSIYNRIYDILRQNNNTFAGSYVGLMGKDIHEITRSLWPAIVKFEAYENDEDIYNEVKSFANKIKLIVDMYNNEKDLSIKLDIENIYGDILYCAKDRDSKVDIFDFDFNGQSTNNNMSLICDVVAKRANDKSCLAVWNSYGFFNKLEDHTGLVKYLDNELNKGFFAKKVEDKVYKSSMPMAYTIWILQRK